MAADMKLPEATLLAKVDSVIVSVGCPSLVHPLPTSAPSTKSQTKLHASLMKGIASRLNPRRKSSSNVLELGNPPPSGESSFRVLSRPDQPAQGSTPVNEQYLRRPPPIRPRTSPNNSPNRPYSYFDGSDYSSNRGSGNTNNSNVTTLDFNKRASYASTEASSIDEYPDDQGELTFQPRQRYTPLPPANNSPPEAEQPSRKPFSLKSAGRAFSFGSKSAKNIPIKADQEVPPLPDARDRSMTGSSYASTATPPKIDLDSGTGLGLGESDFGDLFSKRKSTIMEESTTAHQSPSASSTTGYTPTVTESTLPANTASTYLNYQASHASPRQSHFADPYPSRHNTPSADGRFPRHGASEHELYPPRPMHNQRGGSPYSWRSNASEEQLMSSPRTQAQPDSPGFDSSFAGGADSSGLAGTMMAHYANGDRHSPQPPRHIVETNPLPRTRQTRPPPSSYRGPEPSRRSPLGEGSQIANAGFPGERLESYSDVALNGGPRPPGSVDDEPLFDAPRPRRYLLPQSRTMTAPAGSGKVMTPAEFERYKKHKENEPPEEDDNKSEASSQSETYEDEDETERQKEAAKQRRKQEAHLAVYRQQMMKVTGEQPSDLPSVPQRVPLERSSASAPTLTLPFDGKAKSESAQGSKSSQEEDEDEEVPLGVLQAHGFPNKNRPPTRTSSSAPNVGDQGTYPIPGGSTRNESGAGGGGNTSLPVFAKNLPQDPYIGASLAKAPAREALAFNNNSHGPPQQPPPQFSGGGNLPPGGLVGVIAGEERAKALRRGSPNARGTYDPIPGPQLPHEAQQQQMMQQMMQQQMPPQAMGPGSPFSPQSQPAMSPGEHSQLQVADQMTKMMQMQMQFMQWAMQNQGQMPNGVNLPPGMQMPNGMQTPNGMQSPQLAQQSFGGQPSFLGTDPMARPMSMASTAHSLAGHQRAASNISRGPSPGRYSSTINGAPPQNGGYAPSIAPSERSVVGQPSRYRAVTPAPQNREHDSRTSSISQQTVQALKTQRSSSRLRMSTAESLKPSIKTVEPPKPSAHEDEDEDAGWAEMQKQRKARQSRWKQSRTQSTMMAPQAGGLEGLYYEGPQH